MKRSVRYALGAVVLLAAGGWFIMTAGEWYSPAAVIDEDPLMIGRQKQITVAFSDEGRGLRHTELVITQDDRSTVVASEDYPEAGIRRKSVSAAVDAAALKLRDGPATLTLIAVDHSLWKNRTVVTRPVQIDLLPPQIVPLNPVNHINTGGACVLTYRLSEAVTRTGVAVGDLLFPGYPVTLSGQPGYVAYFAIPQDATAGAPPIRIVARDRAGNETQITVPALIKKRTFRTDRMNITDAFLEKKMPEFQAADPALRGKTPLETFLHINTALRLENLRAIQAVCAKSEPRQLWQGPFLRMKNAAPMASFGDHRTYFYNGKPVGESIHNGVDLASTTHAPIEAANAGIVRFAGPLGIYGN
ncbi:MAG: M23 family metallopeptidase, partial [Thermodesulfobacteriota bacterium]